ncbi:hypothetical protein ACS127_09500 [Amphibacillus sp. Q70]|uniref:hypothetical protein n=1 Tax=Amphibacillus sp. Q70 TaxID=3453416 RepID=UPI003F87FBB3
MIYTYFEKDKETILNNNNDMSDAVELNYLKKFSDNFKALRTGVTFLGVLLWFLLILIVEYSTLSMGLWKMTIPSSLLLTLWIFTPIYMRAISKRIAILREKTGDFSGIWAPTWVIKIKNQQQTPEIDKLSYLGNWRLGSTSDKKQEYYYQLQSHFSEEDIKQNISSVLNIDANNIKVISSVGLYPIGFSHGGF